MLTPEYLAGLPQELVDVFTDLEDYIIRDIARRLVKTRTATSTAELQRLVLQQLGMGTKEITEKIAETLHTSEKVIEDLFRSSAELATDNQAELFEAVGIRNDAKFLEQIANAAIKQAQGEIENLTKTLGFPMKNGQFTFWTDAYRQALSFAELQVASGAIDYNTAIRQTIRQFASSGICTIGYASGRTYSIEAAARMCVLNGVSDMANQILEKNAEDIGADGWEITAHADCAPDHEPIQGRQYTLKEYEQLNNNLERPIGTLGCRHMAFPIILGISEPAYSRAELQKLKDDNEKGIYYEGEHYTGYEAQQMQRRIERSIRKTKRELIGFDEAGLKDDFTAGSIKLRRLRTYYSDFSEKAGLMTQNERAQVSGYTRSMSGKVLFAEKKELEKYSSYHYNDDGTIVVTDDWKSKTHPRIPARYKPNAVVETFKTFGDGTEQVDRSFYDSTGWLKNQVHSGNHGTPKTHKYGERGEHAHDYEWNREAKKPERITRELTEDERKENGDIV